MLRVLVLILFLFFTVVCAVAQEKIEVSFDKSVLLIFNVDIKPKGGWNCGQKELVGVAVQENKMVVQAKEEYFEETNLIVELVDGSVYAFDLIYNNTPKKTFHIVDSDQAAYTPDVKSSEGDIVKREGRNERKKEVATSKSSGKYHEVCDKILASPDYLKRIGVISRKMFLYVGGIYVFENKLYFKVNLKNVSSIPYEVDYYQFLIKNVRSGLGRSVSPRAEMLTTVYEAKPEVMSIGKDEVKTFVFVFDKFTISDDKKLFLEFWEKNGDRNLEIPVESIEILNAKNL